MTMAKHLEFKNTGKENRIKKKDVSVVSHIR
jgi:hypothetical protein